MEQGVTGVTPRMADCLDAIRELTLDGVPPSITELAVRLRTGRTHVHDLLSRLRGRRLIDWEPRKARSVYVIEDQVSPAALEQLSDEALRKTAAFIAGILAQRGGGSGDCGGLLPDSRSTARRTGEGGIA